MKNEEIEEGILQIISEAFYLPIDIILGKCNRYDIITVRHLVRYCYWHFLKYSKVKIAKLTNCTHATVINSIERIESCLKRNPQFMDDKCIHCYKQMNIILKEIELMINAE